MSSQAVSAPSALSGTLGEMIGEFLGTGILILFGDGCVATFALYTKIGNSSWYGGNAVCEYVAGYYLWMGFCRYAGYLRCRSY